MEVLGGASWLEGTRQELEPLEIWEVRNKAQEWEEQNVLSRIFFFFKAKLRKDHSFECLVSISNSHKFWNVQRSPEKSLLHQGLLIINSTLALAVILCNSQRSASSIEEPQAPPPKNRCQEMLSKGPIKHKLKYYMAENKSQQCESEFLRSLNIDR